MVGRLVASVLDDAVDAHVVVLVALIDEFVLGDLEALVLLNVLEIEPKDVSMAAAILPVSSQVGFNSQMADRAAHPLLYRGRRGQALYMLICCIIYGGE